MRILTFKPKYGICIPFMIEDCIDAFEELGHMVKYIPLDGYGDWTPKSKEIFYEEIESFFPDFIFTIIYNEEMADLFTSKKIPHAVWVVDKSHPFPIRQASISPYCIFFVWDRFYGEELESMGFKKVYHLPNATNPKRFMEAEVDKEELEKYRCDISFVGISMYPFYRDYYQGKSEIKDKRLLQIIQDTVGIKVQNPFLGTIDILIKVQEAHQYFYPPIQNQDEIPILISDIENTASSLYRKEIIEEVSHLRPNLFGDKGWVDLLNGGKNVKFFGMIGYDRVGLVYKASKINLNISKITVKTGLNQRIFDVPAADSFLLTDYRRDLSGVFNLDKEIVCYRDKEDLRDKVQYFLNHPKERDRIVSNVKERVLKEHTYKERMGHLIEVVGSELF